MKKKVVPLQRKVDLERKKEPINDLGAIGRWDWERKNIMNMAKTQSGNIMTIAQSEFTEVIAIIRLHRSCALQAVNTEHVTMCWEIGKYISSHIQSGKWGDKVVEGLADYIHCADPTAKGFSKRNLYNMVRFYETYSTPQFIEESSHYQLDKILQTPSAQITLQPVAQIETPSVAFMQTRLHKCLYV